MALRRIVVAEDDAAIRGLVVHHLEREGFHCDEAADGPAALRFARGADLIVLDLGLPMIDGLEVLRTLRREQRPTPVLVLTARIDEIDRVLGLEMGADDYVTKPFSPREVVARIRAIARRAGIPAEPLPRRVLRFGRLEIDEGAREARVDGVDVGLKPREFALLFELAANPGVALSRSALLEKVWGYDFEGDERTVDVHVRRLRLKLQDRARLPAPIATVQRLGYKFVLR